MNHIIDGNIEQFLINLTHADNGSYIPGYGYVNDEEVANALRIIAGIAFMKLEDDRGYKTKNWHSTAFPDQIWFPY